MGGKNRLGLNQTIDLYEAFEAVCLDEIEFRGELKRYARPTDGKPITPAQVPPLVPAHLLPPTSRNKMFNARIDSENFGGRQIQSTVATGDQDAAFENLTSLRKLLTNVGLEEGFLGMTTGDPAFRAYWGGIEHECVVTFLEEYRWADSAPILQRQIEYLKGAHGSHEIRDWLFMAPQLAMPTSSLRLNNRDFGVFRRSRIGQALRYKVYSEPHHISVAASIAGIADGEHVTDVTRGLRSKGRAVLLLYPIRDPKKDPESMGGSRQPFVTVGFALLLPPNGMKNRIRYSVRDASNPDAVTVDV